MSPIAVALLAPIAALLAALVAGTISFVALLVSKENKISEFRQVWIDALRLDLADYIAALGLLTYAEAQWVTTSELDNTHWHDYLKTMQPAFQMYSSSMMRIRLRVNRNDSDRELKRLNLELLDRIDKLESLTRDRNYGDANELAKSLHLISGPILKIEWNRVKQGEPMYRLSKWVAGVMSAVSFGLVVIAATMSLIQLQSPDAVTPEPSLQRTAPGVPAPATDTKP